MIQFVNRNLGETGPDYYYSVWEFVTTFEMDEGKNEAYSHVETFKGNDLLKCRAEAKKYYWKRRMGLEGGKYFLPFASPEDFVSGKNAAFSITLSLVEYYTDDELIDHPLMGEDYETTSESKEIEAAVLKEKGYSFHNKS